MTNEIQRKITSLTLMTIMLAGGMTIAFPGFTPDAYAANANLIVSVENTGVNVSGPQVIEVLVIDSDIETSIPTVTVNGAQLAMIKASDGNFYAYIADEEAVLDIKNNIATNPGLNFGTDTACSLITTAQTTAPTTQAESRVCGPVPADGAVGFNAVRSAETVAGNDAWPIIQLYDFTDDVDIQYQRAGGAQTSTFAYTDDASGLTLDRSVYPVAAQIHATITDHRLNIDPTSDDVWTWNTVDGTAYYMLEIANNPTTFDITAGNAVPDVCSGCMLIITSDDVINSVDTGDRFYRASEPATDVVDTVEFKAAVEGVPGTIDNPAGEPYEPEVEAVIGQPAKSATMWVTVTEDAPNAGTFTTTNNDNDSAFRVSDTTQRGASATMEYDGDVTGIVIQHSVASIDIASPDDVWTSGLSIPITVIDGDANKNSLDGDDLAVSDPNSIIPTLVTGDPFTLGELGSSLVTWVVWNAVTEPGEIVKEEQSATVESFSERAILTFDSSFNLTAVNDATSTNVDSDAENLNAVNSIVIDFENGVGELQNSLINQDDPSFIGHNFINYNVESLETNLDSIDVLVDGNQTVYSLQNIGDQKGYELAFTNTTALFAADANDKLQLKLNFGTNGVNIVADKKYPIVIDFFSFGFENNGDASDERIANQIIRLELEENGSNTGSLEGSLEYIMINQLNIDDEVTYNGLTTIGLDVSFIVIEDLTSGSAPSVTYLDVDTTGDSTPVSAQEDAPSHTGVVTMNVESFKAADTVTVTLEDLDLNVDSGLIDSYTVVDVPGNPNDGVVGETYDVARSGLELGRLLDVTFDDKRWTAPEIREFTNDDDRDDDPAYQCLNALRANGDKTGLADTGFTLTETGTATGIFTGTFTIPAQFCRDNSEVPESVTGLDIEVNYVDFRDASGETIEVVAKAGVKANTGSISLDRTVYPVPFGVVDDFRDDANRSTTPAQDNSNTRSLFPIHQSGMNGDGIITQTRGLDQGEFLPQGDLIVYVTVTDPDFDVSASGRDSIALQYTDNDGDTLTDPDGDDTGPVSISIIRGSQTVLVDTVGTDADPLDEIAPDAGIFEASVTIRYNDGPADSTCPSAGKITDNLMVLPNGLTASGQPVDDVGCILQGDILLVEYEDPTDASGKPNTVTDSATFDLRNGVLQSDKTAYIIGSDMILTLIEPDFNLDSSQDETYDLDLIRWSSSAATVTMGNADGQTHEFDPRPLSLRETGPSTGIFQIIIETPESLDGDSLQRGEEIDLEYTDWGPSGADYVGDQDEDIRLTVYTSNFGATIKLDQKVYTWTDKVYITVTAPDHNFDDNLIDEIGTANEDPLRIATKGNDLDDYRLVETGFDTGIFTGEVILTGFKHDVLGHVPIETGGNGPTDGYLETESDSGISVSYEFSEDETVFTSSIIRWNIGDVQWLEASYPASGTGVVRVIDPDMNLNPEAVDNLPVNIASTTDASGITLTVTETNEATGIFEGTVFFTVSGGSSGHRLRVSEGDTVTADYSDSTLPSPYTTSNSESITSTTIIGTIVPPLERAPATNLRIVNTFGNSIDAVSVDQQVQIVADLSSGQDKDQDFAYLIQIQDGDGVTVSLSWIAGSLPSGHQSSPSGSWTPTDVGTYTVTTFVWESINNPTALSPTLSIDVSVN